MFFGKTGSNMGPWIDVAHIKSCSSRIDIFNEVWCTSNGDRMPKLHPRKLKHQFTKTGPIVLALHLLGLGFWMFRVLNEENYIQWTITYNGRCCGNKGIKMCMS